MESSEALARKIKILERELEIQREAIDRLKKMARPAREVPLFGAPPARKSA